MADKVNIPKEFQTILNQIMVQAPVEYQNDDRYQEKVRVYLKLGGRNLARQFIKSSTMRIDESPTLVDKKEMVNGDGASVDEGQEDEKDE